MAVDHILDGIHERLLVRRRLWIKRSDQSEKSAHGIGMEYSLLICGRIMTRRHKRHVQEQSKQLSRGLMTESNWHLTKYTQFVSVGPPMAQHS